MSSDDITNTSLAPVVPLQPITVDSVLSSLKSLIQRATTLLNGSDPNDVLRGREIIKATKSFLSSGLSPEGFHSALTRADPTWKNYGHVILADLRSPSLTACVDMIQKGELQVEIPELPETAENEVEISSQRNNVSLDSLDCTELNTSRSQHETPLQWLREHKLLDQILEFHQFNSRSSYFNFFAQVISVFHSAKGNLILRLWDGSRHNLKRATNFFWCPEEEISDYIAEPMTELQSIGNDFYVDVVNFLPEESIQFLKSGDVVFVSNIHFYFPKDLSNYQLVIHDDSKGTATKFKRGVYLISHDEAKEILTICSCKLVETALSKGQISSKASPLPATASAPVIVAPPASSSSSWKPAQTSAAAAHERIEMLDDEAEIGETTVTGSVAAPVPIDRIGPVNSATEIAPVPENISCMKPKLLQPSSGDEDSIKPVDLEAIVPSTSRMNGRDANELPAIENRENKLTSERGDEVDPRIRMGRKTFDSSLKDSRAVENVFDLLKCKKEDNFPLTGRNEMVNNVRCRTSLRQCTLKSVDELRAMCTVFMEPQAVDVGRDHWSNVGYAANEFEDNAIQGSALDRSDSNSVIDLNEVEPPAGKNTRQSESLFSPEPGPSTRSDEGASMAFNPPVTSTPRNFNLRKTGRRSRSTVVGVGDSELTSPAPKRGKIGNGQGSRAKVKSSEGKEQCDIGGRTRSSTSVKTESHDMSTRARRSVSTEKRSGRTRSSARLNRDVIPIITIEDENESESQANSSKSSAVSKRQLIRIPRQRNKHEECFPSASIGSDPGASTSQDSPKGPTPPPRTTSRGLYLSEHTDLSDEPVSSRTRRTTPISAPNAKLPRYTPPLQLDKTNKSKEPSIPSGSNSSSRKQVPEPSRIPRPNTRRTTTTSRSRLKRQEDPTSSNSGHLHDASFLNPVAPESKPDLEFNTRKTRVRFQTDAKKW